MAKLDFILFGATSFVGQILARYMTELTNKDDVKWAMAGRSQSKLDDLKASLGEAANNIEVIVADAEDESQLTQMCKLTKVVISTVGPYALYGETLIKACVTTGTDYCDLTGEPQWITKMLGKYEEAAKISGARIVNSCGFDSIPSDLGVYFLQRQSKLEFEQTCSQILMRVKTMKGAASGGTIASMMNLVKEATFDSELRKSLQDPYSICPQNHGFTQVQSNLMTPKYEEEIGQWVAPFVMAAINIRIVHRSNALLEKSYGELFKYDEAMMMGKGVKGGVYASALTAGLGSFMAAAVVPPSRWLMENYVLPKPGEGPSLKQQLEGSFDLRFYGKTCDNQKLQVRVTGDRDPGYGSTAKMLAQSAICLAKDVSKSDIKGGFWTPAAAMGDQLIERLEQYAGLAFRVHTSS